jgi:hypothetical protein
MTGDDMLLHQQIVQSLAELKGLAADVPRTAHWAADRDTLVEIDFTAVDSLGCAFRELRMTSSELKNVPFETLRAWADEICKRVTYLLEQIVPLERDAGGESVLIRSAEPTREPDQRAYYEILVTAPGTLSLRRYACTTSSDARQPCDVQVTQQTLVKLVGDIVAAIPVPAAE